MRSLRPQPGGFEGLGVATEIAEAQNLAVPKRRHLRDLSTEVQSGGPARSREFAKREDRIAEVADVVESSLQLEVHLEAVPGPPDSGVASAAPTCPFSALQCADAKKCRWLRAIPRRCGSP